MMKRDYTIDFSNLLPTGAVLTGSATVTADVGITVDSDTVASPDVTVRLSGGTTGERYDVDVQIDSDGGETYNRKIVIVCADF